MEGSDVYEVLRGAGVHTLYHANTVITSCTFLQIGGLASRGHVERHDMPQTPQNSDPLDKRFGIFNDVFTDGVDVHNRASTRNYYGPVLFALPLDVLIGLPPRAEVLVTRDNPVNWNLGAREADRYFLTEAELREGYTFGDFGKHVTFRLPDGLLRFPEGPLEVVLDDPHATLPNSKDAYPVALSLLRRAARRGGVRIEITKRQCNSWCTCLTGNARSYDRSDIRQMFAGEP